MNFRILGPKGHLILRSVNAAHLARVLPGLLARFGRVQVAKVTALVPEGPITMYDSVDLNQIPADAEAVAGYVGGHWPTFKHLAARWPKAKRLSIAVMAQEDADCLDVENGDASNTEAAFWFLRQRGRGLARPRFYTSVANAEALKAELAKSGIKRPAYRLWTAHYTGNAHRCSHVCGFGFDDTADATQYTDHALNRNLDASLCAPDFFD